MMVHLGHIYLGQDCLTSTFQLQYEVVHRKHHSQKAKEEAVAVIQYNISHSDDSEEMIIIKNYVDEEAKLKAHFATKDTFFAQNVTQGEEVAKELALEEQGLKSNPIKYSLSDFFEWCTCEGTYGLNDEGNVATHECHC